MSGLPRQILKWLQSLDLSYSVRNVRRDFSNGYLIAEIISRYYQSYINIKTYKNSTSQIVKKDNWNQLEKVIKILNLPIKRDEMDCVIHRQENASLMFICKLYSILTGKSEMLLPPNEIEAQPSYAQPTGSFLIKQKLTRDPNMLETEDIKTAKEEASKILNNIKETHRKERFQERLSDLEASNHHSPQPTLSPVRGSKYQVKRYQFVSHEQNDSVKSISYEQMLDQQPSRDVPVMIQEQQYQQPQQVEQQHFVDDFESTFNSTFDSDTPVTIPRAQPQQVNNHHNEPIKFVQQVRVINDHEEGLPQMSNYQYDSLLMPPQTA